MTQDEKDRMYNELSRVIREADVVCCTAIGAGAARLEGTAFSRVLVDEASQATEYASIVPLCRGTRQFVLSGDQCQLPPVGRARGARCMVLPANNISRQPRLCAADADGSASSLAAL